MGQRVLQIEGEVERPLTLSFLDLEALPGPVQLRDVSRIDPARKGDAVTLAGLLDRVRPHPAARYLTLHSSTDDFHASIPLDAIRERAILIYRLDGEPLPA